MKTFATPKEALLDAGKITAITRGRISRDNHAWLDAEKAAGRIAITDSVPKRTPSVKSDKPAPKTEKQAPTSGKYIADIVILFDKHDYHAVGNDGTVYGMAEVCNTCRVSLVQNMCEHPTILGNIPVRIVPNA